MMFRFSFIFVVCIFVVACSSTSYDYKGVYEATSELDDLTVPPGLDKPDTAADTTLPELQRSIKTYSSYEESASVQPITRYAQDYEGMRFVRSGSLYWLEIDSPGEEIWDDVRSFFLRLGFDIIKEQPNLGYMETDWLENRVEVPTNFISQMLSILYSTELADKYRIRLEWDAEKNVSRLFINHQGLREIEEEEPDNISAVTTKWAIRPSDPDLEVEMLMRFMAFRGLEIKVAEQAVTSSKPTQLAKLTETDGIISLTINEPFARAWRHIGIAIDRLGFLVEDKNRDAGIYYIELPDTFLIPKQGGLFGQLFSSTESPSHLKYLIVMEDKDDVTVVNIKANGEVPKDMTATANKILKDIQSNIL